MSSPKSLDVLGVGCNSVDYVYRLPAPPRADSPTAKMRISSHTVSFGGQTATTMAACAALGLRAGYLGAVGNDDNGQKLKAELARRGIDVSQVLTRGAPNRFAVIAVDNRSGERLVFWDRDPHLNLSAADIPPAVIASARVVHVDDEDQDASICAAQLARKANVIVTSDIDRMTNRTAELVAAVTVPMFNEHTLPEFTGEPDLKRALFKLRRSHPGMLCVTLGPSGAMLLAGDELIYEPGFEVDAVDTTAAGDVFRAAFICALLRGQPPREMLRFANAAAAISVTRPGAMASVPDARDVADALSGAA
jgi:sugar/nucleoside kinase (ribokinase family)